MPRILELVRTRIPRRFGLDPIRDIQVLCPMNRGGVGARSLNIELQAALNPAGERKVERFGWTFRPRRQGDADGERLRPGGLQRETLAASTPSTPTLGEITVRFDDRAVAYGFGELDALVPAYATTIHKRPGLGVSCGG